MELKNQVCSLEQAKRLKELGLKGSSIFYHVYTNEWGISMAGLFNDDLLNFPAWNASELGEMLPGEIRKEGEEYTFTLETEKIDDEWHVFYMAESETMNWELDNQRSISANEAEGRAAMLIYLLENKLVNPQSTNQ